MHLPQPKSLMNSLTGPASPSLSLSQIFHCLRQAASGGDTLLVDGQRVLQQLQQQHPDTVEYLQGTKVSFDKVSPKTMLRGTHPVQFTHTP